MRNCTRLLFTKLQPEAATISTTMEIYSVQ